MTFGYECRPSIWQRLRSNSHLVIAALGTVSFIGVAGVALWLAIPSIERPAFASPSQEAGAQQAAVIEPAAGRTIAQGAKPAVVEAVAAPAPGGLTGKVATASAPTTSPETALQAVNAQAGSTLPAETSNPQLAAFAAANRAEVNGDDGDLTAAVPTAKPAKPAAKAAKTDQTQTAAATDGSATQGHILRGVTLRSGPKKGADAIGTVPAKTAVQIFTCTQWCEIAYDGKRGWVYKSFVARD